MPKGTFGQSRKGKKMQVSGGGAKEDPQNLKAAEAGLVAPLKTTGWRSRPRGRLGIARKKEERKKGQATRSATWDKVSPE